MFHSYLIFDRWNNCDSSKCNAAVLNSEYIRAILLPCNTYNVTVNFKRVKSFHYAHNDFRALQLSCARLRNNNSYLKYPGIIYA